MISETQQSTFLIKVPKPKGTEQKCLKISISITQMKDEITDVSSPPGSIPKGESKKHTDNTVNELYPRAVAKSKHHSSYG